MKINEINTPAILLNLDYMEHNLKKYCGEAKKYGKEIWPMVKTHKSTELARLQEEYHIIVSSVSGMQDKEYI